MNNAEFISQCRYYSGEQECPFQSNHLIHFWEIERYYVNHKGVLNKLEYDHYKGIGGKDYKGIPPALLTEFFFLWSKGVYTPQDHLEAFYKLVDEYLEIASEAFPKDEIPGTINNSTINQSMIR